MNEGGAAGVGEGDDLKPSVRVGDMSAKNKSGSSDGSCDGGGGGGSDTHRRYLRHLSDLLKHIKSMRDLHPELLDISFVVGVEGGEHREFRANSTVLSVHSEYFKAMCFGPMRQPDRPKIINDMTPGVFEKVLSFAHAADGCLNIANLEEAWSLRYAANQFLMEGLVDVCDEFIRKRLTFRNGLELLEQARAFRVGEDFKKQLNLVIKNRHAFILTSDDLVSLPVSDLLDLIRLYRGVKTDFIIRAIHIWGRHMDEAEFQKVFRDVLYGHIKWDNLSNFAMLDLHKAGTLPMEKEHEAMLAILSRTYPIPKDESETICSLDLRISRDDHSLAYRPFVGRLLLRTTKLLQCALAHRPPKNLDSFVIDSEGVGMLRDILEKKNLAVIHVDPDDVRLEYSINGGDNVTVEEVRATVTPVRIDNRDVSYIELTFDPINLEKIGGNDDADCVMVDDSYNIYFEARFSPELFRDLADRALVQDAHSPLTLQNFLQYINFKEEDEYPAGMSVQVLGFSTIVNGKRVLDHQDAVPKFFYADGEIPIFSRIN